jgi:hypothetical protein
VTRAAMRVESGRWVTGGGGGAGKGAVPPAPAGRAVALGPAGRPGAAPLGRAPTAVSSAPGKAATSRGMPRPAAMARLHPGRRRWRSWACQVVRKSRVETSRWRRRVRNAVCSRGRWIRARRDLCSARRSRARGQSSSGADGQDSSGAGRVGGRGGGSGLRVPRNLRPGGGGERRERLEIGGRRSRPSGHGCRRRAG